MWNTMPSLKNLTPQACIEATTNNNSGWFKSHRRCKNQNKNWWAKLIKNILKIKAWNHNQQIEILDYLELLVQCKHRRFILVWFSRVFAFWASLKKNIITWGILILSWFYQIFSLNSHHKRYRRKVVCAK